MCGSLLRFCLFNLDSIMIYFGRMGSHWESLILQKNKIKCFFENPLFKKGNNEVSCLYMEKIWRSLTRSTQLICQDIWYSLQYSWFVQGYGYCWSCDITNIFFYYQLQDDDDLNTIEGLSFFNTLLELWNSLHLNRQWKNPEFSKRPI